MPPHTGGHSLPAASPWGPVGSTPPSCREVAPVPEHSEGAARSGRLPPAQAPHPADCCGGQPPRAPHTPPGHGPARSSEGSSSDGCPTLLQGAQPAAATAEEGVSELEVFASFLKWWRKAISSQWEATWFSECLTEDCTMTDLLLPTPLHMVGRDDIFAYWAAVRQLYGEDVAVEVDWGFEDPVLAEEGVISATSLYSAKYATGHYHHARAVMWFVMRGHRICQILTTPFEGLADPCEVPIVRQWRPTLPIEDLRANMSVCLVASEDSPDPQTRDIALGRRLAQEFRVARLARDWDMLVQWGERAVDPNCVWTDHCTSPRSLRVCGRDDILRFTAVMLASIFSGAKGKEDWNMYAITSPEPGTVSGLSDLKCDRAADGYPYHISGWMECKFGEDHKLISMSLYPRDLQREQIADRGEPMEWQGECIDPQMWRQWRKGADGAVCLSRPCAHNDWDNVRLKRGWVILRCRTCGAQWRQRPFNASGGRCRAFTSPYGCGLGGKCPLLHVHAVKRSIEERKERESHAGSEAPSAGDGSSGCPAIESRAGPYHPLPEVPAPTCCPPRTHDVSATALHLSKFAAKCAAPLP